MQIKKMKAAILAESNKPLVVDDVYLPEKLMCGQVLVKIIYSGICGAQINEIEAAKGKDKFLPHLLGHEASGIVIEAGPGVTTVKTGQHVVLHWRKSSGIQSATPEYKWNGRKLNAGWVTTFNEYAVVSENRLTVIPDDFDMRIAPLFGCAVTTAFGVINNDAKVKIGQSVVIYGVGGVGLNVVQAALLAGAYPVVAVDIHDNKLDMAREIGAHYCFNSLKVQNITDEIKAVTSTMGPDVVIDTTGLSKIIEQAYDLTHKDGTIVLVGVPRADDKVTIDTLPIHFNKILTGSEGGSCIPDIDIPRYVKMVNAGILKFDNLITHEFTLDEINDAIELMKTGTAGRILIRME
ncbi:MAG TPA: zinc-binding dehydrogenase [Methanocorpusculum sp.]|nr:zinc-binding dehydrogenase [Methanocorpusculum sp.]